MAKKLFITNERMLWLINWAVQQRVADTETEFLNKIKFPRTNIGNIRAGNQGFTVKHILNACQLTGTSTDFIFGLTNSRALKPVKRPIDLLKEAVVAVDQELKRK